MAKKGKATKKTILMLSPMTHLKLKVCAAATGHTMGNLIKVLLDRLDPDNHTVEQQLQFLEHLEMFAKEDQDKAVAAKINNLEIRTEEAP